MYGTEPTTLSSVRTPFLPAGSDGPGQSTAGSIDWKPDAAGREHGHARGRRNGATGAEN